MVKGKEAGSRQPKGVHIDVREELVSYLEVAERSPPKQKNPPCFYEQVPTLSIITDDGLVREK